MSQSGVGIGASCLKMSAKRLRWRAKWATEHCDRWTGRKNLASSDYHLFLHLASNTALWWRRPSGRWV